MFDVGWSELLLIGVVALIVVGPKELPRMLRTVGQYVGRAKSVAREFQRSLDDAAREMDVQELRDARRHLSDLKTMKVGDIGEGAKPPSKSEVHASSEPRPVAAEPAKPSAPKAATPADAPPPDAAGTEAKDAG